MRRYFLRRLLLIVPTLIGVSFVVFLITRFAPGGPVEQALMRAQAAEGGAGHVRGSGALSEDQVNQLKAYFGYDKPPVVAYGIWISKLVRGDLGFSFRYGEPVKQVIEDVLPLSLVYAGLSLVLTYLISIPMGIFKAMKHQSIGDTATSVVVFVAYAVPGYALGALLVVYLAAHWGWFPMGQFVSDNWSELGTWQKVVDFARHATLPLACYTLPGFAFTSLLTKNQLLDNLAADYVRTAVAKGASYRRAVFHHAFRNSLVGLATDLGVQIGALVVGSVLIESIFDLNGIGQLFYHAVVDRDPMVVMGVLMVEAIFLLLSNILADLLVAAVDPRIRFK